MISISNFVKIKRHKRWDGRYIQGDRQTDSMGISKPLLIFTRLTNIKTGNVRITQHWGAFVQPLLQWQSSECYIFWVWVLASGIQHEMPMRHIVICGLPGSTVFFHIISKRTRFSGKSYWTQNVFWFSVQLLSETFLILRRRKRDKIKNVHWSSCIVTVILVRFW